TGPNEDQSDEEEEEEETQVNKNRSDGGQVEKGNQQEKTGQDEDQQGEEDDKNDTTGPNEDQSDEEEEEEKTQNNENGSDGVQIEGKNQEEEDSEEEVNHLTIKNKQPLQPADTLLRFQYQVQPILKLPHPATYVDDILYDLANRLECDLAIFAEGMFEARTVIEMRSLMDYWWKPVTAGNQTISITEVARQEMEMYQFHSHQASTEGYLWLQRFSITQQILWQDPLVYILMHCLLSDHPLCIHPYPDPAYTLQNKSRLQAFICEANPKAYPRGADLSEYDHLILQVPLHDEADDMCDLVVENAPAKIQQLPFKGAGIPAFSGVDVQKLGLNGLRSICRQGGGRLMHPFSLHAPLQKGLRSSISASFIGVQDSGVDMEVNGLSLQNDFARALSQMELPSLDPHFIHTIGASAGRYIKFPAAFIIQGPSPVGQAVAGLRQWDDPLVMDDQGILLGENRDMAWKAINGQRNMICEELPFYYLKLRRLEQRTFGNNSYFNWRERNPDLKINIHSRAAQFCSPDASRSGSEGKLVKAGTRENIKRKAHVTGSGRAVKRQKAVKGR
ncbi:hypothetical protein FQN50_010040, partial [Emmonsiellopsis sp. PD_5]